MIPHISDMRYEMEMDRMKTKWKRRLAFVVAICLGLIVAKLAWAEISLPAIAQIESSNNPKAVSFAGAKSGRGLYQISEIALKEWNNFHPKNKYSVDDLFKPEVSGQLASWLLRQRYPQILRHFGLPVTDENLLICFNAGCGRVGKTLPKETVKYITKYRKAAQV